MSEKTNKVHIGEFYVLYPGRNYRYGVVPNDLPDDELVELLAYILARRSPAGALQSLAPAALRDHVQPHNMLHTPAPAGPGSHDAEVNDYLGGGD